MSTTSFDIAYLTLPTHTASHCPHFLYSLSAYFPAVHLNIYTLRFFLRFFLHAWWEEIFLETYKRVYLITGMKMYIFSIQWPNYFLKETATDYSMSVHASEQSRRAISLMYKGFLGCVVLCEFWLWKAIPLFPSLQLYQLRFRVLFLFVFSFHDSLSIIKRSTASLRCILYGVVLKVRLY